MKKLYVSERRASARIIRSGCIAFALALGGTMTAPAIAAPQQDNRDPTAPSTAPEDFKVHQGDVVKGGLKEIIASDDERLIVQAEMSPAARAVQIEFTAKLDVGPDTDRIAFSVEGFLSRANIVQRVYFFDYRKQRYVLVDAAPTTPKERVTMVIVEGDDLGRFVNRNGEASTLITYNSSTPKSPMFMVHLDQVGWLTNPERDGSG